MLKYKHIKGNFAMRKKLPMLIEYDLKLNSYIVKNCKRDVKRVVIPAMYDDNVNGLKAVTKINSWAFSHCTNLKSIEIPNSIKKIGNYAFSECESLINLEIPNGVKIISEAFCKGCINLETVKLSPSVTYIGYSAFQDCVKLKNVEIPNSVTSIDGSSFKNCTNLTNVEIPITVSYIGDNAFSGVPDSALGSYKKWKELSGIREFCLES